MKQMWSKAKPQERRKKLFHSRGFLKHAAAAQRQKTEITTIRQSAGSVASSRWMLSDLVAKLNYHIRNLIIFISCGTELKLRLICFLIAQCMVREGRRLEGILVNKNRPQSSYRH